MLLWEKEMKIFLETERLILRQFTEDDADNLLELDSDPEVVRGSIPLWQIHPEWQNQEGYLSPDQ